MCYYKENRTDETGEEECLLVKHSVVVISDDIKHDAFAVKAYEKHVMEILNGQIVNIEQVIKFSDGAACQYKGKNTFAYLSKETLKVTHNYFETSHGKSPCDGLGAVIKNTCYNAMVSGEEVIGNAKDAYNFCKQKLNHTAKIVGKNEEKYISKRNIVFVESSEIDREDMGVKTIIGTRALHSVQNMGQPFKLKVRSLSCFCQSCIEGTGQCTSVSHVEPWQTIEQKCSSTPGKLLNTTTCIS
jgi:hypothetical protein